jgi:ketosteroid isomerase-like protein
MRDATTPQWSPTMHPNEQLIHRFYESFAKRDAEGMAACYHADVKFSDPVFVDLKGSEAGDMWRMLTERASDLVIRHSGVRADDSAGSASWEADYTFSQTKRFVKNRISAQFKFKDGLIVDHRDTFDLWAWSKQALGPAGLLLGWTPLVQNKIRKQAGGGLAAWRQKHGRS